jgi:hypothetical protein
MVVLSGLTSEVCDFGFELWASAEEDICEFESEL